MQPHLPRFCASLAIALACTAVALGAPVSPAQTAPAPVVCIDPGHPSENGVGATGRHISELHSNWVEALAAAKILRADGYSVVLTKSAEHEYVTNVARAETANNAGAELMLRLHCDSEGGSGYAVYFPDRTGKVGGASGPSAGVIAGSKKAAQLFHAAFRESIGNGLADRGIKPDTQTLIGGRQGALTGSIYSKVPVILIEMAVLTNSHDDVFMASPAGQGRVAKALAAGVEAAVPSAGR
jgi:N-acetylmuramoyl-L-alanine amidase